MKLQQRILIVRACAIGDFILNLPVLRAIAAQNPGARFTLVGNAGTLSLAETFIDIEAIHSIESPPWSTLFASPVPRLEFDTAWVWMTDSTLANNLRESGIRNVFQAPAFPASPTDVHAANHLLATAGLPAPELPDLWVPGSSRVLVHPGSGSSAKCWPLFEDLLNEIPDTVVITGPCETGFQTNRPRLENLRLRDLAKEIRSCRVFIGNDSGITHLAAYWGCPTIALFGPTDPRVWGPVGRRVKIIRRTIIDAISVTEVQSEIRKLL